MTAKKKYSNHILIETVAGYLLIFFNNISLILSPTFVTEVIDEYSLWKCTDSFLYKELMKIKSMSADKYRAIFESRISLI